MIQVGAATGVELKEKQHRVEDSLSATRAAMEEGIVAGGGAALRRPGGSWTGSTSPETPRSGATSWRRRSPSRCAGSRSTPGTTATRWSPSVAAEGGVGFDALTGELRRHVRRGIMDPLKVTRCAIQSAASIAALLLTTETLIVEEILVNPGEIHAPGFGDLAEGLVRPSQEQERGEEHRDGVVPYLRDLTGAGPSR